MSEYMYKPGDLVRVRSDLSMRTRYRMTSGERNNDGEYPHDVATEDMCKLAGQVINIERYIDLPIGRKYLAMGRYWVDEMFSGFADNLHFRSLL